ncbi:MAG: glycosyltransferase family 4 protein [Candidatus Sericytochromatia bacterium]|nr:glycosyltransferase family 4 protein [Candidatus Sericytochromatia bacterium]
MRQNPSKILLLSPRIPPDPGGVAQAVWRQAKQLHEQGISVELWGLSPGDLPDAPFPVWRPTTVAAPINALSDLEAQSVAHCFSGPPPDLIHGYYLSATAELALALGEHWQVPVVLSARGNDLDRDLWLPERREMLLKLLPKASALSGVTRALTQQLAVLAPACPVIQWVPNSVDSDTFAPQPRSNDLALRLGIPQSGTRWGFVGELRQKKGLGLLLLAFQALAQKYADLSLLLIGEVRPGPDRQLLQLFRKQNPQLSPRLIEIPSQPHADLPALYAWLDAVVFPSLQEGLANACLEALSCARPVVATEVGGFPDLICNGQEGRLISAYQLEPLIVALEEVYLQPEKAQAWGEAGRLKMCREFGPEQELENWLRLYQAAGLKTD